MQAAKNDIISKLQTDILHLQGFKENRVNTRLDVGLGPIVNAFPHAKFPTACIHEFISDKIENTASTSGFVAGLLNGLMHTCGVALWISASRTLFPPALIHYGIHPDRFIFIDLKKERDALWAMDEALKCGAPSAVIGELQDVSFMNSRRWQLAVEESQVTGFILQKNSRKLNTTTCVSRWRISALPSEQVEDLPGIGFPKWNVELLRVRNGKPGSWDVTWKENSFHVKQRTSGFKLPFSIRKAG